MRIKPKNSWIYSLPSKLINGVTVYKTVVPKTGEIRWIDPNQTKDFNGIVGYRFYNDNGILDNQYTQALQEENKLLKDNLPIYGITNQAANERADEYANKVSLTPERFVGMLGASVPLAAGALGATVAAPVVFNKAILPLADYVGGTSVGKFITKGLTNPYFTKGVESAFAAHGINHAVNEGIKGPVDAAMTALEITPLGRLARPMYNAGKEAAYNIADRYLFMPHQSTYTRGIGMTDAGLQDAVTTGVFRGNPRGTEQTANMFDKMFLKNRNHFRDIVKDTKIPGIESRYQSRTLTKEDFDALKKASEKYKSLKSRNTVGKITLIRTIDPLENYATYEDYTKAVASDIAKTEQMPSRIASGEIVPNTELSEPMWFEDESGRMFLPQGKPFLERFGPNSDYLADGTPLSYWYADGRNPVTQGHAYAKSNYGVRVNIPEDYQPFMHELHLHPSFFRSPKFSDPNVEIFGKGPLGLTVKLDKETLQPVWKRDLSNMFKRRETIRIPQITAENAATTALEIAPLTQPIYKGFQYAWEAMPLINKTVILKLNNLYDPYTSFSARYGYYGNPIERFYGTMARRLNLSDKGRPPELIRKLETAFPIKRDGTLQVNAFPRRDFLRTNFTTDRPVVSHSTKNNWDHMDAYIVDPTVVDWRKAASIEPSDTFFPNLEITAKPNQATLISGNKLALNEAKQLGIPTLSSIRLRQLYEQMLSYLPKLKSIFQKEGFKSNAPLELRKLYAAEIQRLLTMRGTPTIKDYQYIENQTGLKSGVTLDNIKKNLLNQVNIAEENTTNIGDMTEDLYNKIYSFTFPNNTKIDGLRSLQAWNRLMLRMPFNKVQYNPATYAEDIWTRQHGYK